METGDLQNEEHLLIVNGEYGTSSSSVTFTVVFSTFIAICGSFVFGSAVGYSSPSEAGIIADLGLTSSEYSVFGSMLTIGAMFGAVFSGRIADLIGRRGAMWVSEIFCIMGWLAIVFSKSAWWLYIGRLMVGCGIGILSYVVPIYVAEITTKNVRGIFTALNQLMIGLGKSFTFLIGSAVSWRTLAVIGSIPCLMQFAGLFFISESPRYLVKIGHLKEFESALQWLRGERADISQEAADIKDYTDSLQHHSDEGIFKVFQLKYAKSIIIGVGLMVFQEFGGLNGYVFYTSSIFSAAGFPSDTGTTAAAIIQILGTIIGIIFIERSGRRPLLLISAAGMCLGSLLTGLSFLLQDFDIWMEMTPIFVLIGILVYLGSFDFGMGGIPWIIMAEIFPINIKGSAGSIVTLMSWVGSLVTAYTFNFSFEWSSAGTFFIYASICGAGIIFIARLVPETKGRTLEEIQTSIDYTGIEKNPG